MNITDPGWMVHCKTVAHKRSLFDHAAACGVPLAPLPAHCVPYYDDRDLTIAFLAVAPTPGLLSRRTTPDEQGRVRRATHSDADFLDMCREYAARRPAP